MTPNGHQSQFEQDLEINEAAQITIPPVIAQASSPYSAFTIAQKRWIVAIVAFAGGFASLSNFIYFPAIPFLAADLAVTTEQINLTVTAYLIMSGIFPSLVGNSADAVGRRPVFIVTLAVYIAANVGLALQSSFGVLFFLRMVQSAGISGSYVVTYCVVGDLFPPSERGGYSGTISFFLNAPPCLGPVISGLLIQRWGWRSIFWFLGGISPCCLLAIVLFLPETSRHIVDDGSVAARGLNRALLPFLVPSQAKHSPHRTSASRGRSCAIPNPLASLDLHRHPGTAIAIASVGIYFTISICLQASLSALFTQTYKTSSLVSGLTYLPFGVASAISALAYGQVLDIEYSRTAAKYKISVDNARDHDLSSFPIEEARLRSIKYSLVLCCVLIVAYGWSLQYRLHMAVPLVLQFFIGLTMQGVFTAVTILLVDTHPDCPSTAQAASNLVRCELAAGGFAVLDVLLQKLGPGWCFVLLAGSGLLCILLIYLLQKRGMSWRQKKIEASNEWSGGETEMEAGRNDDGESEKR